MSPSTGPRTTGPSTTPHAPPWNRRRIITVAILAGLIAAGLAFWQIIDLWHAAAGVALAVTASILWSGTETIVDDPEWPHTDIEARAGGRHDVSDLGWTAFGRDGRVTDRVVRRIRALAADRLRAHGVDPADPAAQPDAERLLGARVHRQLLSREPPTARTVQTWLDAIERLGAAPATDAARAASSPAPTTVRTTVPTTEENRA